MKPISELLAASATRKSFEEIMKRGENISPQELAQRSVDRFNTSIGHLNDEDGYDCKLCLNRGYTAILREGMAGVLSEAWVPCRCQEIRKSIMRMRRSGLEASIRDYTLDKFEVKADWQREMVRAARDFLENGVPEGRWFFMCGQPGCGKTHICTAIARKLLYDRPVYYMVWPTESKRLKAIVNEADEYAQAMRKLESIDVLYIDDLFKPVKNDEGKIMPPNGPDMRLAFEILNYRYINRLVTIISTEWYLDELLDFDEATASRIAERSAGYKLMIARDKARNYRIASTTMI